MKTAFGSDYYKEVMRRIKILLFIFILVTPSVFAELIDLGGKKGWNDVVLSGTRVKQGEIQSIVLKDSEYKAAADTEMLLPFNMALRDISYTYQVKQNNGVRISGEIKKKGEGSAVFSGDGNFLELIPSKDAVFAAGSGKINNFSIEFWLNPARLAEGEHIIQWTGAFTTEQQTLQQEILCGISGRNIFWDFSNLFLKSNMEGTDYRLTSSRSLIPKRWHHHMIRYNSSTGLLEYLIDGVPEDMVYTTPTEGETSEIYAPLVGNAKPTRFLIGRDFTGYIDELKITDGIAEPDLDRYSLNSGTAASRIIDLGFFDSRFNSLAADYETEGRTQLYFFYRISNDYFTPGSSAPRWIQFDPGELLPPEVKGRYLQLMVELYPDGTGENSPALNSLQVEYEKNLPPLPPAFLSGIEGNKKAVISWKAVTDSDIAGYKIYYGTKPGMYFGTGADEGNSPIDAGSTNSIEINGLENGKLYYFAVTSYDNAEYPHESVFSREISIRPSAIIRNE